MILCISREFGSGGHEIGKRISENLSIPFYDRALIDSVTPDGIKRDVFEKADEKNASRWLFTAQYEGLENRFRGMPANDILFGMQSEFILEKASEGSCVMVGRCSDYVLKQANIPCVSLFITAPFGERVKSKMELLQMSEKEVIAKVRRHDKQRKAYYNFHTGLDWGKPHNYDICINSATTGIEHAVTALTTLVKTIGAE